MNFDPSKIAPSVGFVLVGAFLFIIGGLGYIPVVANTPMLSVFFRIIMCALGFLLIVIGPICVFVTMPREKSKVYLNQTDLEKLSVDIVKSLIKDPAWAGLALDLSQVKPQGETVFSSRMKHFYSEKETMAKDFSPLLIERCKLLAKSHSRVYIFVDSGTTLYPFFQRYNRVAQFIVS